MGEETRSRDSGERLFGLLVVTVGLVPLYLGLEAGPWGLVDGRGPGWVLLTTAAVFMAAGVAIVTDREAVRASAALVIAGGMALVAAWLAFGSGERPCSVDGFGLPPWACRGAWSMTALVLGGVFLLWLTQRLQRTAGGAPRLDWTVRLARGMLWFSLSPLLLLVLAVLLFRAALTGRMRLGLRK